MVQNLKWATAHLSRRLGIGLGARHSDTARRRAGVGAGALGTGRAGVRQALGVLRRAGGRCRQLGARRSGRAELAGAR